MMANTDCDINPVLKHTEQQEDTDDVPVVHLFIGTASGGFLCIMVDDLRSVEEPAVFIQQGEDLSGLTPPPSLSGFCECSCAIHLLLSVSLLPLIQLCLSAAQMRTAERQKCCTLPNRPPVYILAGLHPLLLSRSFSQKLCLLYASVVQNLNRTAATIYSQRFPISLI